MGVHALNREVERALLVETQHELERDRDEVLKHLWRGRLIAAVLAVLALLFASAVSWVAPWWFNVLAAVGALAHIASSYVLISRAEVMGLAWKMALSLCVGEIMALDEHT